MAIKHGKDPYRETSGKERLDLLPPRAMLLLGKLFTEGCVKYDERNWEGGLPWSTCIGAIDRHLKKFMMGDDIDEELMVPHVIAIAWNALVLAEYMFTHKDLDDRTKHKDSYESFMVKFNTMLSDYVEKKNDE